MVSPIHGERHRVALAVILISIIGAGVFEFYQYEQQQQPSELHAQEFEQQTANLPLCQALSLRVYPEPGYHLQNGTFVFSKTYDTFVVWTLINCNGSNDNYSYVGIMRLLSDGFNSSLQAYYTPDAFTVFPGKATYEQKILLYLPSLRNGNRNLVVRLIILAYSTGSARVAGIAYGNVTV
jgi:hypothetical protein